MSSGFSNSRGSGGEGPGEDGKVFGGGSATGAHIGGFGGNNPYKRRLISLTRTVFLYQETRDLSLIEKSCRLVSAKSVRLFINLSRTLL